MAWFGFWIFASVLVAVDAWLYSQGHECLFFAHKSPEEKAIQHFKAYGTRLPPPIDELAFMQTQERDNP